MLFAIFTNSCFIEDACADDSYSTSHSFRMVIAAFALEFTSAILTLMAMRSKNLQVRLKEQQAVLEARERASAYSDHHYTSSTLNASEPQLSPFELFQTLSNEADDRSCYSAAAAGQSMGVRSSRYETRADDQLESRHNPTFSSRQQHNDDRRRDVMAAQQSVEQQNNTHVVQAEISIEPRSRSRQYDQLRTRAEHSRRAQPSYENIPDGCSQPPTPVASQKLPHSTAHNIHSYAPPSIGVSPHHDVSQTTLTSPHDVNAPIAPKRRKSRRKSREGQGHTTVKVGKRDERQADGGVDNNGFQETRQPPASNEMIVRPKTRPLTNDQASHKTHTPPQPKTSSLQWENTSFAKASHI